MDDKEILSEIVSIVRNYYQSHYTGYDTFIDKSNIISHTRELCKDVVAVTHKLRMIRTLIDNE